MRKLWIVLGIVLVVVVGGFVAVYLAFQQRLPAAAHVEQHGHDRRGRSHIRRFVG